MSVHKLTLEVTDPEDGPYFVNKSLTRIHGYLHRHDKNNIGLYFQRDKIMLYASELSELEQILADEALVHDVRRHIFSAKFEQADAEITLCKRVRTIYDVQRKVREQIRYIKKEFKLSAEDVETKRRKLLEYYNEQAENGSKKYFVIKTKEKRFTIFVKPIHVKSDDFVRQIFNSYGLLRKS
ncbi:type I-F CRISPR-associated endoribonuclease Cas6/Csy4 [Candidatus Halobeggiatoa sp. HSG11]|nr:type I-F CRISPR-associated endoribonuclease Cas6/Csy4 [Candidatus Halobeggiatoa sp. HSG11]